MSNPESWFRRKTTAVETFLFTIESGCGRRRLAYIHTYGRKHRNNFLGITGAKMDHKNSDRQQHWVQTPWFGYNIGGYHFFSFFGERAGRQADRHRGIKDIGHWTLVHTRILFWDKGFYSWVAASRWSNGATFPPTPPHHAATMARSPSIGR